MRKFDSPEREQISLDLILFSSLTRPVVMRIKYTFVRQMVLVVAWMSGVKIALGAFMIPFVTSPLQRLIGWETLSVKTVAAK